LAKQFHPFVADGRVKTPELTAAPVPTVTKNEAGPLGPLPMLPALNPEEIAGAAENVSCTGDAAATPPAPLLVSVPPEPIAMPLDAKVAVRSVPLLRLLVT